MPTRCPDIQRWVPDRWDQFIGNYRAKRLLRKLVKRIRQQVALGNEEPLTKLCILLTGSSRSGKTALVKFFIRCILCEALDMETLDPCRRQCTACAQDSGLYGDAGIFRNLRSAEPGHEWELGLHVVPLDCSRFTHPSELITTLRDLNDGITYGGLRIVHMDEVHRLVNRSMDDILLKTVEDTPNLWILSTAKPGPLEDMLLSRAIKLSTEPPTEANEMECWLCDRCDEWGIRWEPEAIVRVVEKSNRVVGTALHALALASLDPAEGLTVDLVEDDWVVELRE